MTSKQNPSQGTAQTSSKKQDRHIDYILVVKEKNLPLIQEYTENLQVLGFEIENERGQTVDLIFIKLFMAEESVRHFSQVYDIGNKEARDITMLFVEPIYPNPFATPISRVVPKIKGEITDAEKIMIVNQVLENTRFSEKEKDVGLSKLIRLKILETAYPLHDGPIVAEVDKNIRSLLFHYWSNTLVTHKQQPLDLIFRYFGAEVAFYFAWLEYFNIMLLIPAILGGLVFLGSALYVMLVGSNRIDDVCKSHEYVCPTCEDHKNCHFQPMSHYCAFAHWSVIFDNEVTVTFAFFMSFWAILFLNLWIRKENKLKMRWYTSLEDLETNIRQAFADGATHLQHNRVSGDLEPYTPAYILVFKYFLTSVTWAVVIVIIFVAVSLITYFKAWSKSWLIGTEKDFLIANARILTMCMGSIIQVIFIKLFQKLCGPVSVILTKFENPKTQYGFDNSILYKKYLLSFTNNYMPLLYIAFLKGSMYTVPHEYHNLSKDVCQPLNCILDLCIQLAFIMTLKDLAGNVLNIYILTIKTQIKKLWKYCTKTSEMEEVREPNNESGLPQWEEEYFLHPTNRYFLTSEFSEMVIKYGLVTFFVAAFPIAPLCALINNMLELRSDAYKLVKLFRRPVPVSKSGIGPWNGILLSVTYLSTATNALVIAFTSDWVPRQVFRFNHSAALHLPGYIKSTLSVYDVSRYDKFKKLDNPVKYCYYRGYHNSTNKSQDYTYTQEYWVNWTFRFVSIFVFEHFILICNAVMSYCIPKFPHSVKEQLDMDQQKLRNARFDEFEKQVEKVGKANKEMVKSTIKLHRD